MSYSTVLSIKEDMRSETIEELRNGHGTGPLIWGCICRKYLGCAADSSMYMFDGTMEKLWPLYKDQNIPEHHRAVLLMTYDKAYVAKKNFARAAADIRKFLYDIPIPKDHVNHLDAIAKIYEQDGDHWAIGLHCTSVSDNPFDGEWNEEKEEYNPADKEECFELYDDLDGLKNKAA